MRKCLACKNPLKKRQKKFCSLGCINRFHKKGNKYFWKGGRYYTSAGYIYVFSPKHIHRTKGGYMLEHRLVMEKSLGRVLRKHEQVHHKNGKKDDNKIENLELMTIKEHRSLHTRGKNNPNYGGTFRGTSFVGKGKDNPMYGVRKWGKDNPNYRHGGYVKMRGEN